MGILNIASKEKMEELILLQQIRDLASHGEDSFVYDDDEALTKMFNSKEAMNNTVSGSRLFKYGVSKGLHAGKALALIDDIGIADWASLSTPEDILNDSSAFNEVFANTRAFKYMRSTGLLEYIPIDYIESNGTQYIDTGVGLEYRMELDIEFISNGGRGLMGNSSKAGHYFGVNANGYYELGESNVSSLSGLERRNITVTSTTTEMTLTADGETITRSKTTNETTNLWLFMINGAGYTASAKLYGCKIYVDESLVHDFVPAKDLNGTICLYDKVDKQFYYNNGTGDFMYDHTHEYGDAWLYNETYHWKACSCGEKDGLSEHNDSNADGLCDVCSYKLYTPLEYIKSTGNQYIDTGIVGKSGIKAEAVFSWTTESSTSNEVLLGSFKSSNRFYVIERKATDNNFLLGYGSLITTNTIVETGHKYATTTVLDSGEQTFIVDGTTVYSESVATEYSSGNNMYLFALNSSGTADYFADCKLYGLKLYEDDVLVRDFIPVLDLDNVACLYDTVSKQFFYNSGEGKFLTNLTRELEYIESTGTQYIDTGVGTTANTRVVLKCTNTSETNGEDMFGLTESGTSDFNAYFMADDVIQYAYGESWNDIAVRNTVGETFIVDRNGSDITVNFPLYDETYTGSTEGNANFTSSDGSMYLFGCSYKGSLTGSPGKLKLYYCKIYNDTALVRDFMPVIDESGIPCLYDKVSETFFYNKGTGAFTAGPEV